MTPEEAVIGACLLDPNVIREAIEHVMPSDFATWQGEQIFQAIIDLHVTRQPVDVVTVAARLADKGERFGPDGGVLDLHRVISMTPAASSVAFYAAEVREAAVRRGLRAAAGRIAQEASDEATPAAVALANAIDQLRKVRDDAPIRSMVGMSLDELMAEQDSYDWVIKHFLERGDRFIFTGGEGAGKSMLVRQMAVFASHGIHPLWLRPIPPVNVVVLDLENSAAQWRRKTRRMFEAARRVSTRRASFYLSNHLDGFDITKDSDLGMVHRTLDENPCDILFIGPLYRLVPRAVMTDDEAAPLLSALNTLRARGCAIVTEAHAGNNRDKDLRPIGSSAFLRWPEFGRGLRKDPTEWGLVHLEKWRGDRDERDIPERLKRGGAVAWHPPELAQSVLAPFREDYQESLDGGSTNGY